MRPALPITLLANVPSRMSDIELPLQQVRTHFKFPDEQHTSGSKSAILDVMCRVCMAKKASWSATYAANCCSRARRCSSASGELLARSVSGGTQSLKFPPPVNTCTSAVRSISRHTSEELKFWDIIKHRKLSVKCKTAGKAGGHVDTAGPYQTPEVWDIKSDTAPAWHWRHSTQRAARRAGWTPAQTPAGSRPCSGPYSASFAARGVPLIWGHLQAQNAGPCQKSAHKQWHCLSRSATT